MWHQVKSLPIREQVFHSWNLNFHWGCGHLEYKLSMIEFAHPVYLIHSTTLKLKHQNHQQSCCKKEKNVIFSMKKMMDELKILWIFRFLYASCEAMSWCEVGSILVAVREVRGLQQTVWRCKSRAMLAWLCWPKGFYTWMWEGLGTSEACKPEDPLQSLSQPQLCLPPERLSKQGFLLVKGL